MKIRIGTKLVCKASGIIIVVDRLDVEANHNEIIRVVVQTRDKDSGLVRFMSPTEIVRNYRVQA